MCEAKTNQGGGPVTAVSRKTWLLQRPDSGTTLNDRGRLNPGSLKILVSGLNGS
jgi:hypothetical protein